MGRNHLHYYLFSTIYFCPCRVIKSVKGNEEHTPLRMSLSLEDSCFERTSKNLFCLFQTLYVFLTNPWKDPSPWGSRWPISSSNRSWPVSARQQVALRQIISNTKVNSATGSWGLASQFSTSAGFGQSGFLSWEFHRAGSELASCEVIHSLTQSFNKPEVSPTNDVPEILQRISPCLCLPGFAARIQSHLIFWKKSESLYCTPALPTPAPTSLGKLTSSEVE